MKDRSMDLCLTHGDMHLRVCRSDDSRELRFWLEDEEGEKMIALDGKQLDALVTFIDAACR